MKKYATLLIIVAGTCWGAIGIFVRALNGYGIESMEIVEIRAIAALIMIGLGILIYDRKLFRINIRHIWCFMGTGISGIFFYNLCYFTTIKASSLSVAAVLLYTAPVFVMIFSAVLFKEKITRIKVISLVMAFAGCMMVSGVFDGSAVLTTKGLIIGIGAGMGYALYTIFSKYALNYGYNTLTVQFYTFLFGTLGCSFFTDFGKIAEGLDMYGVKLVLIMIAIGFISTTIPNVLYTGGLKYIENGKASILASVEPVMAIVFGILIFHEIPGLIAGAGMVLSLGAIILISCGNKTE